MSIKHFVTDIDGTLTDGKIYIGDGGEAMKAFSVKDGYALGTLLRKTGIEPIVITARKSRIVERRCAELGVTQVFQGVPNKLDRLVEIVGENGLGSCAYFGDDLPDLACMQAIKRTGGLVGCPADAVPEVREICDYICLNRAGEGAAREFIEWLIQPHDEEELAHRVTHAVEVISKLAATGAQSGVYGVENWLTVTVKEIETLPADNFRFESHRHHIAILWILKGEEAIDVAPDASLFPDGEYDEMRDVAFWLPPSHATRMVLKEGCYAVFYPRDAHMPHLAIGEPCTVKIAIGTVLAP